MIQSPDFECQDSCLSAIIPFGNTSDAVLLNRVIRPGLPGKSYSDCSVDV